MIRKLSYAFVFTVVCVLAASWSATVRAEDKNPALTASLRYLLTTVRTPQTQFESDKINALLDFALSGQSKGYQPEQVDGITGAYHEIDVRTSLARLMKYGYNPQIPSYLTLPAVVRLGAWSSKTSPKGPDIRLWEFLGKDAAPVVLRGVEYEMNTPDLSTGAYYRYDMDRMLVLMRHDGRDVLVSVTRQRGPSSVGMKGAIIGSDQDWNYFYSGQEGLTKGGLGWAKSHVYDSFSVCVYFEPEPGQKLTRNVLFKWLKGGWSGINFVRRDHIQDGIKRFADGLRKVLENERLPEPEQLADAARKIRGLSAQELHDKLESYSRNFEEIAKTDSVLSRSTFSDLTRNGAYVESLNREERESILMVEFIKSRLGKKTMLSANAFDGLLAPSGAKVAELTPNAKRSQ